jgi:hypothetical protein
MRWLKAYPGAARDRGAPNGLGVRALPPGDPRWLEVGEQYADMLSQVQHASDVITVTDTLLARISDAEVRARLQVIAARALWLAGAPAEIIGRVDTALSDVSRW